MLIGSDPLNSFADYSGVAVGVAVLVGVAVTVAVAVLVGVAVTVAVAVSVGVAVTVAVAVSVGVAVTVAVGVDVAGSVGVAVGMAVSINVGVAVRIGVGVGHFFGLFPDGIHPGGGDADTLMNGLANRTTPITTRKLRTRRCHKLVSIQTSHSVTKSKRMQAGRISAADLSV